MLTVSDQLVEALKGQTIDLQTRHFFGGGLAIKRFELPQGHFLIQHKHKYDHMTIIGEGRGTLTVDGEADREVRGGECVFVAAKKNHKFTAIEDLVIFCVHATSETNETLLDEHLIVLEA